MKIISNSAKAALTFVICTMALSSASHIGDSFWGFFEIGFEKMLDYASEKIK